MHSSGKNCKVPTNSHPKARQMLFEEESWWHAVCLLWKREAKKNECAMKTKSESEFIAADVTFSLSAFFAFFLPWMAKFVIIRFIIEECERKSASSEMFLRYSNCAMNRLFTENLSLFRKCFARVTHARATTSWIFAWTSDDLPRFHFSSLFFLIIGGAVDLFSSPVCSWTEMVACSPCCGVFCSLWSRFNCSKIEFLEFSVQYLPSISHLN